ncbi:glycosyltransferase family 4 protein [Pseudoxanthomonas sp. CAU 1598]|uniref:Glycosyltransferase family 4 protein n=1 Tax=Pseudomarimonas arenosa TaxID=2774145 RepID=A0AAW3ZIS3_9GAMM|nr:glycosyltransferase family 4 protein [Pseudomarimonas arenosa]
MVGAVAVLAALLSILFTELSIRYALRRGVVDQPGARRSHRVPTPRGGGVAIGLVVLLALILLPLPAPTAWSLGLAVTAVALVGWIDDHRPLPVLPRLTVHLIAACLITFGLFWPAWIVAAAPAWLLVMAPLLIMAAINFCNFMDGINGIASSQAALVLLTCALLIFPAAPVWASFWAAAAAGCLGFLPFNFPRARIFLGDVGSGSLGLLVATALAQLWSIRGVPAGALLVLISAFAIDAGLTLLQRVLQGKRWYRPHREHLYQWWVRSGQSHTKVTLAYGVWTVLMAGLVWLGQGWSERVWNTLALVVMAGGALVWWLGKRRLMSGRRQERRMARTSQ